jgi:hypothetical protein
VDPDAPESSVPFFLISLLVSSLALFRDSRVYAAFAILQLLSLLMAIAALRYRIPVLDRIAYPASALLVLNTAAIVGLYKFLFTRGPLWKIWNSCRPVEGGVISASGELTPPDTAAAAPAIDMGKSVYNDSQR